jgi:hypothetical protein
MPCVQGIGIAGLLSFTGETTVLYNIETHDAEMLKRHAKDLGLEVIAQRLALAEHTVEGQSEQHLFVLKGRLVNKTVLELLCIAHGQQCLAMYDPDTGRGSCPGPKPWPFDLSFFAQC